jgi:hypothetical protein
LFPFHLDRHDACRQIEWRLRIDLSAGYVDQRNLNIIKSNSGVSEIFR